MGQPEIVIHPSVLTSRSVMLLIADLCHELDRANTPAETHIHRIRVDIKKLRAWIRLINDMSGDNNLKETDRYLKNIAKQFSFSRDIEIIPETLDWLRKKTKKTNEMAALDRINRHMQYKELPHPLYDDTYININRDILSEMQQKSIKVDIEQITKHGLIETNKKAEHCAKKAFSSKGSLKDLHRLRKWIKYLCYQMEFIQASCPSYCEREIRLLDKLGKQLGRIHDLDIVRQNVKKLVNVKGCKRAARTTSKLVDKQIGKLQKRVEKLYREIFSNSPEYSVAGNV